MNLRLPSQPVAGSGSVGSTDGTGTAAKFNELYRVSISPDETFALLLNAYDENVRKMVLGTWVVTTLAGSGYVGSTDGIGSSVKFNRPSGIDIHPDGGYALVTDSGNKKVRKIVLSTGVVTTVAGSGSSGSTNGVGATAKFKKPFAIEFSPDGKFALIADLDGHQIRNITTRT